MSVCTSLRVNVCERKRGEGGDGGGGENYIPVRVMLRFRSRALNETAGFALMHQQYDTVHTVQECRDGESCVVTLHFHLWIHFISLAQHNVMMTDRQADGGASGDFATDSNFLFS